MKLVLLTASTSIMANSALTVEQNAFNLIVAVVSTVALVVATIKWVDGRIDSKIKNYSTMVTLQHEVIKAEIRQVKALLTGAPVEESQERKVDRGPG